MQDITINGKMTISRPRGSNDNYASITLIDVNAGSQIIEVQISLAQFAECLLGMGRVDCQIKASDIDRIGKVKEQDTITFEMPNGSTDKSVAIVEAAKHTPQGWEFEQAFSSQDSFSRKDGTVYAKAAISRWVDNTKTT